MTGSAGEYTDAETGFTYLRARYYDPATGQFLSRDPLVALTGEPYGYAGANPLNAIDPSGLNWLSDRAGDVGGFIVEHRHTIIDVGTTLGAATVTGACVLSVVCGVAVGAVGVAAVGIAGVGVHVASDRTFRDDHQISVGESFFRAGFATASGVACGVLFTQGCFGSAAFPAGQGLFGSSIASLGVSRLLPALFLANLSVLKQGLLAALFPHGC